MRKVDPAKHAVKRNEILAAAELCFVRNGLHGASISDICKEAGISPGHLYHYFASKEAIVGAMTDAGLDYATGRLAEMMASDNAISALLSEIDRGKPGQQKNNHILILDVLAEASRNPAVGEILRSHSLALRKLLSDFLRQAQTRAQVDATLDPDMAAAIVMAVLDGAKTLSLRDPGLDLEAAREALKTLLARYLAPQAATKDHTS
jgi:TetR/AcrR family transcriptional repressor of uid operon